MNLAEYIKHLQQLVKEHPELKKATAVYSADDEGNQFSKVVYHPTPGHYSAGEFNDYKNSKHKPNAVCVN